MEKKRDVIKLNKIILIGVVFSFLLMFMVGNISSQETDDFGLKISKVSVNKDGNLDVMIERNDGIKAKDITCVSVFSKEEFDKANLDEFMSLLLHDRKKSYSLEDIQNDLKFKGIDLDFKSFFENSDNLNHSRNIFPKDMVFPVEIKIPNSDFRYLYMYCVSYLDDSKADWMGNRYDQSITPELKGALKNMYSKYKTSEFFRGSIFFFDLFRTEKYIFLEPNLETSSYFLDLAESKAEVLTNVDTTPTVIADVSANLTISNSISDLTMSPESLLIAGKSSQDYVCVDHICYINKNESDKIDVNISFLVNNVTSKDIYVTSSLKDNSSFLKNSIYNKLNNASSKHVFNFNIGDNLTSVENIQDGNVISFTGSLKDKIYLVTIADYNKGGSPTVTDFSGLKINNNSQVTYQILTEDNFLQDPNYELDYYYLVPVEKNNYNKLLIYLSNKKILNFFCEDCLPNWLFYEKDVVRAEQTIDLKDVEIIPEDTASEGITAINLDPDFSDQITINNPLKVYISVNYLQFLIDQLDIFDLDEKHKATNGYGNEYDDNSYREILWDLISKKYAEFCTDTPNLNYPKLFEVGKDFGFSDEEMAQFWAIVTQESSFGKSTISKGTESSYGMAQINYDVWCSGNGKINGYNQLKDYFPNSIVSNQTDYDTLCDNIKNNKEADKDQTYSLQFGAAVYKAYRDKVIGTTNDFPREAFKTYDHKDAIDAMFAIGYKYNSPNKGFNINKKYTLESSGNSSNFNNIYLPVTTTFQTVTKLANYLVYKKIMFDINTLQDEDLDNCIKLQIKNNYSKFSATYPTIPFLKMEFSTPGSSAVDTTNLSSSEIGPKILENAEKYLGEKYVSGGRKGYYDKDGVDCIGLQYLALRDTSLLNNKPQFNFQGIPQTIEAKKVFSWGGTILEYVADEKFVIEYSSDLDYLQPGDFLYFDYSHAGIYKGYNSQTKKHEFIHANTINSANQQVNTVFYDNIEDKLKITNTQNKVQKLSSPIYVGRITNNDFGSIKDLARYIDQDNDGDWNDNKIDDLYTLDNTDYFDSSNQQFGFESALLKGCILTTIGKLSFNETKSSDEIQNITLTKKDIRALNALSCSKTVPKYQEFNSLIGLEFFKNLRVLDLSGSKINNSSIIDIINLKELRELDLSNTNIKLSSDLSELAYLSNSSYFPNLNYLTLDDSFKDTQIVNEIKNIHPGIVIEFK